MMTENSLFATKIIETMNEKCIHVPVVQTQQNRVDLISRIESVTLKIIQEMNANRSPKFSYIASTTTPLKNVSKEDILLDESSNTPNTRSRTTDFGSKSGRDKFTLMTIIMATAHRLLTNNTTMTRRSLYYHLKNEETAHLVKEQRQIDEAINNVANLLNCSPWNLNLLPSSKGLVVGNLTFCLTNNREIDCSASGREILIPQIFTDVKSIRTKAKSLLVVEKDTIFQALLKTNSVRSLNAILITGKGYPDVATRMLVRLLCQEMNLPTYIIVDADPFGVEIMLTYRFGSANLWKNNEELASPKARWLGIFPSELALLGVKPLPLANSDMLKLDSIITRPFVDQRIMKELSIMRKGKAEIEAVSSTSVDFFVKGYLISKIKGQDYL